jgi:hypothetical protein
MADEQKKCPCGHPADMHVRGGEILGKHDGGCAMLQLNQDRERSHLAAFMIVCPCQRAPADFLAAGAR